MEKLNIGKISFEETAPKQEVAVEAEDETKEEVTKKRENKIDCHERRITFSSCVDMKSCNIGGTEVDGTGKILELSLTLEDVCPRKRVAVAVMLKELDSRGREYTRGLKVLTVPASGAERPRDIKVDNIWFVIPDSTSVASGNERTFVVRYQANYIDAISEGCNKLREQTD